jgi:hypothetical protein
MAGIGGVKGGSNGVGPFQLDHHYADMTEPGRHVHDEHDGAIAKILGLEQRNVARTSKSDYADKPPMTRPGKLSTEQPQASSQDAPAKISRP